MPDDLNEVLMSEEETEKKPLIRVDWKKLPPAFWTVTSVISLTVNVILIAVLLTVGWHIFQLKPVLNNQVLYGLYDSFVKMDQAHIQTTIPVETNVPAKFDLILDTDTTVILNEDTLIKGATVDLLTGGLTIRQA
ncbi:MAG: hypothetical protein JW750_09335, partial [Anaerolineaceae bacterium]|nr:hypothetical protein [Anaerolineaceae bacterium]